MSFARLIRLLPAAGLVFWMSLPGAQTYPGKPIRIVFPYAAGSGVDSIGRAIAQRASEQLGQPMPFENRAGANGLIAMEHVARSAPDGYTISFSTASAFLTPHLVKNMPLNLLRDLQPISNTADAIGPVAVHSGVPASSLTELIDIAKRSPGKLSFGTIGNGSIFHATGELFMLETGTKLLHVPFKGAALVYAEVLAQRIDIIFHGLPYMVGQAKVGKAKILAVTSGRRHPLLPAVPAITEVLPKIPLLANWVGWFGPANLPDAITRRLHGVLANVANSADIRRMIVDENYFALVASTPEEFSAQLRREFDVAAAVFKAAGIQPE